MAETDATKRAELAKAWGAGLELVQALKDEVDRLKNADGAGALLAGERALELSTLLQDPGARPLGLWAYALGLTVQGRFSEALPHFNEARRLYGVLARPVDGARAVMRQVQALAMTGDLGGALRLAEEIRDTFTAAGQGREAAQIEISIGGIYTRLGQTADAEEALLRALAGLSAAGDRQGVAQAHINLGNTYRQQDRFAEAREQFSFALGLLESLGLTEAAAGTTVDLAQLYRREGRLGEALTHISRARRLYEALGNSSDAVLAQLEEARVHLDLNLLSEAEGLTEPLVGAFAGRAMRFEHAEALSVLGLARARSGNPAAFADLKGAEQSWEGLPNRVQAALAQLHLASLYLQPQYAQTGTAQTGTEAGGPETALRYAEGAVATLRAEGARSDLALGLVTLAQTQLSLGDAEVAQTLLLEAEQLVTELALPYLSIQCYRLLGLTALGRGDAAAAEKHFIRAVDTSENVRASLRADEFKAAYSGDKLAVYGELAELLLAQKRPAEAFGYAERAKSRALLDLLARGVEARAPATDPEAAHLARALAAARAALEQHYLGAEAGMGQSAQSAVLGAERRVAVLTRELEHLAHTVPAPGQTPSAAVVCAGLPEGTTLLEYFASGDSLIAFVLTRSGVRAQTLGSLAQIKEVQSRLSFFLTRVAQGRRYLEVYGATGLQARIDKQLSALYDLLIRPLNISPDKSPDTSGDAPENTENTENTAPGLELVVVPHGSLQAVPFAALFDGTRYLLDYAQLSVAPSAAIYLHCRNTPQHRTEAGVGALLAFGVPTESIPGVQAEVRAIAQLARDAAKANPAVAETAARTIVGADATLASFFAGAPHAGVLHLATHGVYRPDNPVFSGLRLADGWLTARDLYTLELRAALVVLSACESALAGQSSGDEQFGLARGFLHAGAPALVASLWPVKDDHTTELIRAFYTRLYRGETVRAALRGAQLEVRALHPNPYYWAAFAVIGDPERTVTGP